MMKLMAVSVLMAGLAGAVFAGGPVVPEIDGSSAVAAVALLSGGLLVLRGRRRK
jgi:LPXTG-motif cell wall-anchored protein